MTVQGRVLLVGATNIHTTVCSYGIADSLSNRWLVISISPIHVFPHEQDAQ